MLTRKQQKQCGKIVFEGYAYTPDGAEVYTEIAIRMDREGRVLMTTTATLVNEVDPNLEEILGGLCDIGGVGIEFAPPPDREVEGRIAAWLEQVAKGVAA